jgi:Fe-S cluster biogenesis protein NfuA
MTAATDSSISRRIVDEDSGRVDVRMVGACYACPMSMATLRAGIEQRLKMVLPEVRSVEAVE